MSNAVENLQHELEAAQSALAEAEARYVRQEAEHQSAIKAAENTRKQIEQAHQEWMSALDGVEDPIFVHAQRRDLSAALREKRYPHASSA